MKYFDYDLKLALKSIYPNLKNDTLQVTNHVRFHYTFITNLLMSFDNNKGENAK